ncbi:MAG: DUF4178 domain-containing protein [Lysobacter sp.]|nr:DUF4178 domain-containing protein [Lysobacter sp.]
MAIRDEVRERTASCPSCGGPLRFRGATSIVAVCAYCRSTLVREGARLEDIGKQADLLPGASLLQLGASGHHRGESFSIVGRIQYRYGAGVWNEWHVLFDRGKGAWLSDANGEHTITYLAPPSPVPAFGELKPGATVTLAGDPYTVTNLETAEVVAGEGELPFRFGAGWKAPVADLRGPGTRFATIDYSEDVPHVYVGERLPFDTFRFTGLRDPDRPLEPGGRAIAFKCAGCGAPIEKHVAATEVVACTSCGSVTDVTGKSGEIVQRNERNDRLAEVTFPLGTTGTWRGAKYEVVGALRRAIVVEGLTYEWLEYLLHGPTAGYLWISEYQGHFSVINTAAEIPKVQDKGLLGSIRPTVRYLGRRFDHFQRAEARVSWLAGEFNWRVKLGDTCEVNDYVAPPLILSSERTENEITWSLGEYVEPAELWKAFSLEGQPWKRVGVAPNQPSPHAGKPILYWMVFFAFLAAGIVAQFGFMALGTASRPPAVGFSVGAGSTMRAVSPVFEVGGWFDGPAIVHTSTNATHTWLGLDLQLTEAGTGKAYRLNRSLGSRVAGTSPPDASADDVAEIASLPPGRYTLAIAATAGPASAGQPQPIVGRIAVRRNSVGWSNFVLFAGFLVLWPLGAWMRSRAFEARRWAESDYAPESSSDDDD